MTNNQKYNESEILKGACAAQWDADFERKQRSKEKIKAAISALDDLEGVPIMYPDVKIVNQARDILAEELERKEKDQGVP